MSVTRYASALRRPVFRSARLAPFGNAEIEEAPRSTFPSHDRGHELSTSEAVGYALS